MQPLQLHAEPLPTSPCVPAHRSVAPARQAFERRDLTLLDSFDAHGLKDLGNATLMERVDTKYVVPRALLADLLRSMIDEYSVLEIDGLRSFRYLNDYFDDQQYGFYRAHHAGRLNRFKMRQRTYLDSQTSWLEVKFKNNHDRTVKTRVLVDPASDVSSTRLADFLDACGVPNLSALGIVQTSSYRRVALASEARGERLTIDFNLVIEDAHEGNSFALGPWAIVEVKQARLNRASGIFRWAKGHGIRPCSFSKYCMGVYFTGPAELKRNRFHPIARQVNSRR